MVTANAFRGKSQRAFRLDDFLVHRFDDDVGSQAENHGHVQTQSAEQQVAMIRALTQQLGGKDLTRG